MLNLARFPVAREAFRGETLRLLQRSEGVLHLMLDRPQARNAIDGAMLREAEALFTDHRIWEEGRVLLLEGEGTVFCAGGDLAHMRAQAASTAEENLEDARRLGRLFHRLAACPVPVVTYVHGAALGGGLGLVACSDFVLARPDAHFGLPEVRLGLVPGVIGPYVVRRLGFAATARLVQSGARIAAAQARELGLVQEIVAEEPEVPVTRVLLDHLQAGPQAIRRARELLRLLAPLPDPQILEASARAIAEVRASEEGRAGLEAFFAKADSSWAVRP